MTKKYEKGQAFESSGWDSADDRCVMCEMWQKFVELSERWDWFAEALLLKSDLCARIAEKSPI
jgi:hypothetical protein